MTMVVVCFQERPPSDLVAPERDCEEEHICREAEGIAGLP